MVQQLVLPTGEIERKADATRIISKGLAVTALAGAIILAVVWWLYPEFPVIPFLIVMAVVLVISLVSYWLNKCGYTICASYLLVISTLLVASSITTQLGGFGTVIAISHLFSIIISGMLINIKASFYTATAAVLLYLGIIPLELNGIIPQAVPASELLGMPVGPGATNAMNMAFPIFNVIVVVLMFYLVAFLSWFAASRLERALQATRQYASEMQISNEKLQVSEEELRASNEELEASNEELRETQEQLVRSEKLAAIGQLAGGVGHELRNPLGAIKNAVYYIRGKLGNSELVQEEPRIMEFLNIVDDEINSSNKIINDLLGFSRVGKPAVSPARIEKVIDDAIAHVTIPESIVLVKNLDDAIPEIKIDTDQIRQVLVNIITNAVQAMPEGGKLTVETRRADYFLQVEITDSGIGIPEEAIGKVFDPLYTMKAKGIGLGLAVCKSNIDRHEGQIEVESHIGKGSTFIVKLPLETG